MNIKAFVLNLPNSKERWETFNLNEVPRSKIKFERIDGIYGSIYCNQEDKKYRHGIIGCVLANRNLIEIAKLRKYDKVLILEDDAQLCHNFDEKLEEVIKELPVDWCILRLHRSSGPVPTFIPHSKNLSRVKGANGAYGWIINSKYYDVVIDALTKNLGVLTTTKWGTCEKNFDEILIELQQNFPFFQTKENLVFHADGYSDRQERVVRYNLFRKESNMDFKIFYTPHVALHAKKLCDDINSLGYKCELTQRVRDDNSIYILYAAYRANIIPKNYIVYQCEQFSSNWFTERYWEIMKGAKQVWEYSENGFVNYDKSFEDKLFYVPAGIVDGSRSERKDIPVLFYGALNEHRNNVIKGLKERGINVVVESNSFGDKIIDMLKRTRVVLNIHYYENGYLETFRVNEALAHGCAVVSEKTNSCYYPEKYNNLIHYGTNIKELDHLIRTTGRLRNYTDISHLSNRGYVENAINSYIKLYNIKT